MQLTSQEDINRRGLRARDAMDRRLTLPTLCANGARATKVSGCEERRHQPHIAPRHRFTLGCNCVGVLVVDHRCVGVHPGSAVNS